MIVREAKSAGVRRRGRSGRRRDAAGTREALLTAGTDLFADRGFDGVPVEDIARKAGVNKAMINYHFGGKRQLYLAIVRTTFSDIVSRVERLADSREPAPDVLRTLVAVVAEMATRRHPHFPAMMLRELLTGGKQLAPEIIAYPLRVAEVVRRIVERGIREGAFRRVDPLLTHLSVVGSLLFFFATTSVRERMFADGRLGTKPPDAAAYVKHVQELITHGLAAPVAGARARQSGSAP
jgi:TetR/AcrR family transcriptional regulator